MRHNAGPSMKQLLPRVYTVGDVVIGWSSFFTSYFLRRTCCQPFAQKMIHLHGSPISTSTQRAALILHEKQVPFIFHTIDFTTSEHKSPAFLKFQPFGQVPYILDDDTGFVLYESRAIGRYVALKYADQGARGLMGLGLEGTARFEQAASVELTAFEPHAATCGRERVVYPLLGVPLNPDALADALVSLNKTLDVYETILSKQRYLAGEELTLADLWHVIWGKMVEDVMLNEARPHVSRWWRQISERKSVVRGIESVERYDD